MEYYFEIKSDHQTVEIIIALLGNEVMGWETIEENEDTILMRCYINTKFKRDKFITVIKNNYPDIIIKSREQNQYNWVEEVKKGFEPIFLGDSILIVPTFSYNQPELEIKNQNNTDERKKIIIYPGQGFGTGKHTTTQLVIMALEKIAKQKLLKGKLIDLGCGSGILSIAGVLLGVEQALAIDNDPLAIDNAKQNITLNNFDNQIQLKVCDINEIKNEKCNIVVANITAPVLIEYKEIIINLLEKDGILILSGILSEQKELIQSSFEPYLNSLFIQSFEEWLCFAFLK